MAEDLYAALGVPKTADADTIKKAYRRLAKELHPDKNPGNKATEARFKRVNHAFEVLGDAKKRKLYDEFGEDALREGFDPDRVRAYQQWQQQQAGGGAGFPRGTGGVRLEDLFGGAGGARSPDGVSDLFGDLLGRAGRRRGPQPGPDYQSSVTIDFASAVRGATLELRPRGSDGPVTVRIPAGAADGSRVRIPGHGGPSPNGGPDGDLLLDIHVTPHAWFKREGDDLHLDVPITVAEAYHGGKVKVPTVTGSVTLKVPEHTQSGHVVRLAGKGVARKGQPPGDLYVRFMVHLPAAATPEVAAVVDKLAGYQTEDLRKDIEL
jgi:curved DNA-binding protein